MCHNLLPNAYFKVMHIIFILLFVALLDIPVYSSRIHSLHNLFSLYMEFKNSQVNVAVFFFACMESSVYLHTAFQTWWSNHGCWVTISVCTSWSMTLLDIYAHVQCIFMSARCALIRYWRSPWQLDNNPVLCRILLQCHDGGKRISVA